MTDKSSQSSKLVEILEGIDLAERYYGFCRNHRTSERMGNHSREDLELILSATPYEFKYHKKENFFSHLQKHEQCEIGLNIAFPNSSVELILVLKTKHGHIGGPFAALARKVARLRDPSFNFTPASPKLPFSNQEELREAVVFGVSLFEDAKRAILAYEHWDG